MFNECDSLYGIHEEDCKYRDEELYFLDAWIKTKVPVPKAPTTKFQTPTNCGLKVLLNLNFVTPAKLKTPTKVAIAKSDEIELKGRKDDHADTKEDKFEPLYDRQMMLKLTTHKSALEVLEEAHKKMEAQRAHEKRLLREHKEKAPLLNSLLYSEFQ